MTEGFEHLPNEIVKGCISKITYHYRMSEEDAMTITYEAYCNLIELINQKKFIYKDELGFTSYLKRMCLTKAKAHYHMLKGNSTILFPLEQYSTFQEDLDVEISQAKEEELQQKGRKFQYQQSKKGKTRALRNYLVAASIALIFIVSFLFTFNTDKSSDDLIAVYFKPYELTKVGLMKLSTS